MDNGVGYGVVRFFSAFAAGGVKFWFSRNLDEKRCKFFKSGGNSQRSFTIAPFSDTLCVKFEVSVKNFIQLRSEIFWRAARTRCNAF